MRIFLVLHPSGNISVPNSMTWYRNLYEPLTDLGYDVYFFRLDNYISNNRLVFRSLSYRESLSLDLYTTFSNEHNRRPFDLFFAYLTDLDVNTECLQKIKQIGIPMFNFSCNNTHQFHLVEPIAHYFDYNLYSEKSSGQKFAQINAPSYWFQMAANPTHYKPLSLEPKYDVSFVGMNYARRAGYINHLLNGGIHTYCFGSGWTKPQGLLRLKKWTKKRLKLFNIIVQTNPEKRLEAASYIKDQELTETMRKKYTRFFSQPVSDDEMIKIFNQSKINLGFLEVYGFNNVTSSGVKQHLHLREFEVPMSGGLYFTNYSDELTEFFEPDKEVVVYRNEHELLDKVLFYLKNPEAAYRVKTSGLKRALSEHTFQIRLKTLFNNIKIG